MKLLVINGPNLNLLGRRQPAIYGAKTMDEVLDEMRQLHEGCDIEYFQSNQEGDIIDRLHVADLDGTAGVALNAGAYTHTSLAIADAIAAVSVPVVEVHISNVAAREPARRTSMISAVCAGTITGLGTDGYVLALTWLRWHPKPGTERRAES